MNHYVETRGPAQPNSWRELRAAATFDLSCTVVRRMVMENSPDESLVICAHACRGCNAGDWLRRFRRRLTSLFVYAHKESEFNYSRI
jgi:hypothetical protein